MAAWALVMVWLAGGTPDAIVVDWYTGRQACAAAGRVMHNTTGGLFMCVARGEP